MKILYAIQGTGNGHISRARDIIPLLQKKGDLDILISGTEADVELGYPVKYTLKGLSFVFNIKELEPNQKHSSKTCNKRIKIIILFQFNVKRI